MANMTLINMEKIRRDTPATAKRVFLNNAGSALMPVQVVNAIKQHIDLESEVGGYAAADIASHALDNVYVSIANLLSCNKDEIAITENATVAWQMGFYSISFNPGDRILTAQSEYAANYVAYLHVAKKYGVIVDTIPNDEYGAVDTKALEEMLDEKVKLISITWIPTNGGLINPAENIGKIAKKYGITYLLDACQAVGQFNIDVQKIGCDMLSATGRKFLRGPRGTGFLFIKKDLLLKSHPPLIDHFGAPWISKDKYLLREDARRFETWENNYAGRLGLGAATDYALAIGLDAIGQACFRLATELRIGLSSIRRIKMLDLGKDQSAIVSFMIQGVDAIDVVRAAEKEAITLDTSRPQGTRLDSEARSLPVIIRASPHYYNTLEEIHRLVLFCERFTVYS